MEKINRKGGAEKARIKRAALLIKSCKRPETVEII